MNLDQPIIPDDELFKDVNLGHEAEKFLKHDPLGRRLVDKSLHEWKRAVYEFEALSIEQVLENPGKVAKIHQRMQLARAFITWMNESIVSADRAEEELHNRDMSDEVID